MENINLPPFHVGQKVVCIASFKKLKKVWGFNYPKKNTEHEVLSIRKHPKFDFWLITIPCCECELCHKSFVPIETTFETISYEKVRELESPLINAN